MVPVLGSNKLCASESVLWSTAPWNKDRGVVDGDGYGLLARQDQVFVPERCRQLAVTQERRVLRGVRKLA
jgi:hypothetical protein